MTELQVKIIGFIQTYQSENAGRSPSYEEIGAGVGLASKQLVSYHLQRMESAGLVKRDQSKWRQIQVTA